MQAYVRFQDRVSKGFFSFLSGTAENHPWLLLCLSLAVFLLLSSLLLIFPPKLESRPEILWTPRGSRAEREMQTFDALFDGGFFRIESFIVSSSSNVLTNETLSALYSLSHQLMEMTAGPKNVTLKDICARAFETSGCLWTSPLDYWWNANLNDWDIALIQRSTPLQLLQRVSTPRRGRLPMPIDRDTVLGGVVFNSSSLVQSAAAAMTTFLVRASAEEDALFWETEFVGRVQKNTFRALSNVTLMAQRSIEDELLEEMTNDWPWIVFSIVLMMAFVCAFLGKFDLVHSKVWLGAGGVLCVMLSLTSALGLTTACGVMFTPVTMAVLPFVVLGIGVNDVFILHNALWQDFDGTSPDLTNALVAAAPSCMLTSLTDFVAFMVASSSLIPAVEAFCIQFAVACMMEVCVMLTVFVVLLVFDRKRVMANRMDLVPCIVRSKQSVGVGDSKRPDFDADEQEDEAKHAAKSSGGPLLFIMSWWSSVVAKGVVQVIVVALFAALLGVSIWGLTQVYLELGLLDAMPGGSYVAAFDKVRTTYFGNVGPPTYIVTGPMNYSDSNVRASLKDLVTNMTKSEWLRPPSFFWAFFYDSWAEIFKDSPNGVPDANFYSWMPEFWSNALGMSFPADMVVNNFSFPTNMTASRGLWNARGLNTTADFVQAISALRSFTDASPIQPVFPYSLYIVFFDNYLQLPAETVRLVGISVLCVAVISFLFIANILWTLLSLVFVLLAVFFCAGLMGAFGIALNPLSMVNLVVAVGLLLEFVIHLVRTYSMHGSVSEMLKTMGPAVVMGAITTILSLLFLARSTAPVFRTAYFGLFCIIVVVGILVGLVLLPVTLALLEKCKCAKRDGYEQIK